MTGSVARLAASAAMVLGVSVFSACGSDEQERSSSNGGGGQQGAHTSVENVFLAPAYAATCELQRDEPAELSFLALNYSSTGQEALAAIATPAAFSVEIDAVPGVLTIGPEASIAAGRAAANLEDPSVTDQPLSVFLRGLNESVKPGTSIPVTFTFNRAGEITVNAAVGACPHQEN